MSSLLDALQSSVHCLAELEHYFPEHRLDGGNVCIPLSPVHYTYREILWLLVINFEGCEL